MPDDAPLTMDSPLPYEGTAAELRLAIARRAHDAQSRYGDILTSGGDLSPSEQNARMDALFAASFGWSLVPVIGWLQKEFGEDVAWRATAMAEDVMTNGGNSFCEDIPYPPAALALAHNSKETPA